MVERPKQAREPGLRLGPRLIPVPDGLSLQAREALMAPVIPSRSYPAPDDVKGWRELVRVTDAAYVKLLQGSLPGGEYCEERQTLGGAPAYVLTPPALAVDDRRVFLDFHGGALIFLGGEVCLLMARRAAARVGDAKVVSVDYRMPPDHPYPAAIDDGVAAYRALLEVHASADIIVGGESAGGNVAAAVVLRARDEGLPLPAALALFSPEVDLTESGDTFQTLLGIDRITSFAAVNALYAAGAPLSDPYLSPLFGDFEKGFPPTFLQSGTRDLLLSNAVRMHRALRRADVTAELHLIEAGPHGGFFGAPEDEDIDVELRKFLRRHWAS